MQTKLTLFFILLATAAVTGQPGSLDPAFGDGGFSLIDFENNSQYPWAIARQPDGKLLVAGHYRPLFSGDSRFLVARVTENGQPDLSFGNDGRADIDVKGWATGLAIQDDGRIVVAGGPNADDDFMALRLLEDGTPDPSFGDGGKVVISFGDTLAICHSLAQLPDGRILLAGNKYNDINNYWPMAVMLFADGAVDPSFGDNGVALFPELAFTRSYINDVQVQEDGKIVLGGYRETSSNALRGWALWRFSPGGEPDMSFGPNGSVSIHMGDFNGYDERINKIRIQPDGSIIAVGFAPANGIGQRALARYLPDGSLDPSFGQNGKVFLGIGGLHDVWVQPDEKILAVGAGLVRLLPDGSPDPGFGTDGIGTTEVLGSSVGGTAMLWQPDNKVVVADNHDPEGFPSQRDLLLVRFFSGLEPVPANEVEGASPWAVFPNPCRDFLSVRNTSGSDSPAIRIRLFNMAGQLALSEELQGRSGLSILQLPAGLYGVEIEDREGRLWRERVVKVD